VQPQLSNPSGSVVISGLLRKHANPYRAVNVNKYTPTHSHFKCIISTRNLVTGNVCSKPTGRRVYLEVVWQQQFAGPEEAEDVAEYLAVPIDEVVLLQAVQHDGLGAVEQTTDSGN